MERGGNRPTVLSSLKNTWRHRYAKDDNASLFGRTSWFGPRLRHLTYYSTHQNEDIDTFMWQRFRDPTLALHGG